MNEDKKELVERIVTIGSLTFGAVTVVRSLQAARKDDDGLQLGEAILRGATLAVSVAIFVRNLRQAGDGSELETAEA